MKNPSNAGRKENPTWDSKKRLHGTQATAPCPCKTEESYSSLRLGDFRFNERRCFSYNDNKYYAYIEVFSIHFFRTATTIASSPPLLRSTRNWEVVGCPALVSPPPPPPIGAAVDAHVLWTWAKDITRANMRAFSSTPPGSVGDSGVSLLGPGGGYLRLVTEV